jgi:hypothetical protein
MSNVTSQSIPADVREAIELMVEETVDRRLQEILGDPDQGLVVREELLQRLKEQQKRVATGERGRPMEEVIKELGLE